MNRLTAPTSNMSFTGKWSMINQTLNKNKITILASKKPTYMKKQQTE